MEHIKWKAKIGYGVTWTMLELLIQEVLLAVTATNPHAKRNNVVLRATSEISKGQQVISPEDLAQWQQNTWNFFLADQSF